MKKVLIIGVSSFIGDHLAFQLLNHGYEVFGTSSGRSHFQPRSRVQHFTYCFGDDVQSINWPKCDWVVYAAHDFNNKDPNFLFQKMKELKEKMLEVGCERHLFISSYSSHEGGSSIYARSKLLCEGLFQHPGEVIVRPGLVVGKGGFFYRLFSFVQLIPLIPIVGKEKEIAYIGINDLVEAMINLMLMQANELPKEVNFFVEKKLKEKEFYRLVKRRSFFPTFFIPLPLFTLQFLLGLLVLFERLKMALPVKSENLLGLMNNGDLNVPSDLKAYVSSAEGLSTLLDSLSKS